MKQITYQQAQLIIDIACPTWKETLSGMWAKHIVLKNSIEITDHFYSQMRNACNKKQHKLFDRIFGPDELKYNVGDLLYCIKDIIMDVSGKTQFTAGKIYKSENKGQITNNSENKYHHIPYPFAIKYFRMCTEEEIKQLNIPKKGTPCLVRDSNYEHWKLGFSDGEGKFYQIKSIENKPISWNNWVVLDLDNLPEN